MNRNPSLVRRSQSRLARFIILGMWLVAILPSEALLVINGYDPDDHNRFVDYENGNYSPNPEISVASLTGLGWGPGYGTSAGVTYAAITNQHIIGGHHQLGNGTTIFFQGDEGVISRTIASSTFLGGTMWVYTLDEAISEESFAPIPIFTPGRAEDFANMQVAMFGQNGRVVNELLAPVQQVGSSLLDSPWAYVDGITITPTDSLIAPEGSTMIGKIVGNSGRYEPGDSNDAVLGYYNDQWGLLGTAYLTSEGPSFFDLLASYYQNLPGGVNATFITVPEPSKMLLMMSALVGFQMFRSRHRSVI